MPLFLGSCFRLFRGGWTLAFCLGLACSVGVGFGLNTVSAEPSDDRLLNLSTRAWVGTGEDVLIAGFSIAAGPEKQVLVRAVGPRLAGFGIPNPVWDPELLIVNAEGETVASNDQWPVVLAETFSALGAFPFEVGSRDAALVAQLPPGNYTAIARSRDESGLGLGLVEVYDLEGATRLSNLSTRARVEADRNLVIAGLVVAPGGGDRQLLLRAVGPTLADFGIGAPLADPVLALTRQSDGVELAANNDWYVDATAGAQLSNAFAASGAFPLPQSSADAALLVELPPGAYTVLVSGAGNGAGPALVEVYDLSPTEGSAVSVSASVASTDTAPGSSPARVTVSRSGSTAEAITVNLSYGGNAVAGVDYVYPPASVTLAAGQASAAVDITPYANTDVQTFNKTVAVHVGDGAGYEAGLTTTAEVTIFYSAGTLYVANLVPQVDGSSAYGTVTLQLASDGSAIVASSRLGNLSSAQTAAYVRLGSPGEDGTYLFELPSGQATNVQWDVSPAGGYSAEEVLAALREGRVFVSIGTAENPTGELAGTALRYAGSRTFTAPGPPPGIAPVTAASAAEAARFLTQTTFGPTPATIEGLVGQSFESWIDAQMALPASSHLDETRQELDRWGEPNFAGRPDSQHRMGAWWNIALKGEDQLRQRVAFALSEIFVVSDRNGTIYNWQEGAADYYDMLAGRAFGNFRDLLEDVTLSPVMGVYLSHLRNAKADPETGSVPDENYAREIMQLFSIGLVALHPDGTLQLDGNGLPIPTYDQSTITEMAKVFTGWSFYHENPVEWRFRWTEQEFLRPMVNYHWYHEDSAKTIVTGRELPAGQGAVKDLRDTLDTLFEHENAGPFIASRLIQRLVTSNPSPGYVHRVAQVFADNGSGVRGDMGAVVKAILLDYEARSSAAAANPNFGKLKEPLLRISGLVRALDGQSRSGRFNYHWPMGEIAQGPLRSPSVFNFFRPDYAPVGELAAAGLFAPEMQIHNDITALGVPNRLSIYSFSNWGSASEREDHATILNIDDFLPEVDNPGAIIDQLDLLLCAETMSSTTRSRILQAMDDLPGWMNPGQRISSLIYLVATSPDAAVQN